MKNLIIYNCCIFVIPLVPCSINAIVPVVGSVALSDCNEKLKCPVEIILSELEASAL